MSHPYIDPLEEFTEELKSFSPSLLVVGGLQMLENFPFLDGKYSSYFLLENNFSRYGNTIGQLTIKMQLDVTRSPTCQQHKPSAYLSAALSITFTFYHFLWQRTTAMAKSESLRHRAR